MKMEFLEKVFKEAEYDGDIVAVVIHMEGFPTAEVIINSPHNISSKLAYYKKTYSDDLEHKFSGGIKIINAMRGKNFADIERQM